MRCLDDDALVTRLVEEQIPLTVCPLSNVRLRVIDTLADHPIRGMIERGLLVTVNSDDPAYFGGYVEDNFAALVDQVGLTEAESEIPRTNSMKATFI